MTPCPGCDGTGLIVQSDGTEPWAPLLALPLRSSLTVLAGVVEPITCPGCDGTGQAAS